MGVYWFTSVRSSVLPSVPPVLPSVPYWLMKFFVKDFSTTMQARMLIFGTQADDGLFYRGIENQPSPAYSSLHLSTFLSFHTLTYEIFHQRFLHNHASWKAHIWYAGWWRLVVSWDWEPVFSGLFFPAFVLFSFLSYFEEWNFSSKISQQPFKLECSYLVCRLMTTCCIVGLRTSLLLPILPCICPLFFPSILWRMKFFVKDFSITVQARMLIFGTEVDDDLWYLGIENQPSPVYSSLHLSNFLSIQTLKSESFHQRYLHNHAIQNAHI